MLSPAIPLRSFVGLPCLLHPRTPFDWLDPPPTQRRSPLTLAVLRIVRSGCPSTSRGSTPRVLIGTLRRFRGTSLHRSVPRPPRVMRRPLFRAAFRYRAAGHVAWSVLFRRRSVLGFPSRDDLGATLRPELHACDGVAFDAFPDGTRGVSDVRPAQVCSRRGCVACFHRREPTFRLPVHRSQCSCCAIGRPGDIKWAPFVVP